MVICVVLEWWYIDTGLNMLAGIPGDVDNPARLTDEEIAMFLSHIPAARDSFERIVPNMLPEEQERLTYLASGMPHFLALDPKDIDDNFQHRLNTMSVKTAGPRGGGSWAPPPMTPVE